MKTLYLVRHAKSSWKFPELDDFDRPLNKRGKRDAPRMAQRLRKRHVRPDLILSSPAKRARKIAQEMAQTLTTDSSALQYEASLYEASADSLLDRIRTVADSVATLMIVGHNPELTTLTNQLVAHNIDNVVTSGVVAITFPIKQWVAVEEQGGELRWYDYPKASQPQRP